MHLWKETLFHGISVQIYRLQKLVLTPYQKAWEEDFEREKKALSKKLDVYHIGSTSIPGCSAKPIIDILGITPDVTQIDDSFFIELGYEPMGEYGIKQRRFFRRRSHTPVNLHIFEDTDPEVERHLRFRNYLREHPEKVKEYTHLKESLAKRFPAHPNHYTLGKQKFIKEIDILAARQASHLIREPKKYPRKKTWFADEMLKVIDANLHLYLTYFAKYLHNMEIVFQSDITIVRSTVRDDAYNYALGARLTKNNINRRVLEIIHLFQNRPFEWVVGPLDSPQDLAPILLSQGFTLYEELAAMYLKLDSFTSNPSSLTFQKVQTLDQLKHFVMIDKQISMEAFEKLYCQIPPILYQETPTFQLYVGYRDNLPVTRGILVLHANVAGIYHLATREDQRNKGFGTAIMEHLLAEAKTNNFHLAVLEATKIGLDLYHRLGFKECGTYFELAHS